MNIWVLLYLIVSALFAAYIAWATEQDKEMNVPSLFAGALIFAFWPIIASFLLVESVVQAARKK